MVTFWGLVIALVTFVFCRLYCPSVDLNRTALVKKEEFEEPEEVT